MVFDANRCTPIARGSLGCTDCTLTTFPTGRKHVQDPHHVSVRMDETHITHCDVCGPQRARARHAIVFVVEEAGPRRTRDRAPQPYAHPPSCCADTRDASQRGGGNIRRLEEPSGGWWRGPTGRRRWRRFCGEGSRGPVLATAGEHRGDAD